MMLMIVEAQIFAVIFVEVD